MWLVPFSWSPPQIHHGGQIGGEEDIDDLLADPDLRVVRGEFAQVATCPEGVAASHRGFAQKKQTVFRDLVVFELDGQIEGPLAALLGAVEVVGQQVAVAEILKRLVEIVIGADPFEARIALLRRGRCPLRAGRCTSSRSRGCRRTWASVMR